MSEPTKNEAELNRAFALGRLSGLEEASGILMLRSVKAFQHKKPEADLLQSLSVELSKLAKDGYPKPLVMGVAERKARACNAENAKTWEAEFHAERKLRKEWEELGVKLSRESGSAEKRAAYFREVIVSARKSIEGCDSGKHALVSVFIRDALDEESDG